MVGLFNLSNYDQCVVIAEFSDYFGQLCMFQFLLCLCEHTCCDIYTKSCMNQNPLKHRIILIIVIANSSESTMLHLIFYIFLARTPRTCYMRVALNNPRATPLLFQILDPTLCLVESQFKHPHPSMEWWVYALCHILTTEY